jgi:hypothetical protein
MAYTASALAFLLADLPKPVVLTGAQIPLCEYSSDATNNFRGALLSAGMKDLPGTSGGRFLLRIGQGIIKKKALWAETLYCFLQRSASFSTASSCEGVGRERSLASRSTRSIVRS